ncbi:MAG TPA: hypothetical protein VL635_20370 [Trinickia sp.]|nr:hypothetical protein [Trinickia sp.]
MRNHRLTAALLCSLATGECFSLVCAAAHAADGASAQPTRAASTPSALSPAMDTPQRQAAVAGLASLAVRLPAVAPPSRAHRIFDVDDYRTLRDATIGDGFETFLVDPHALVSGKRLRQALYGSGEWRFVVMANGRGVGLITVARMNGKWSMVEAGASELANEIESVAGRYARQSPSAQLRFVRSPQAVADFIEVSAANAAMPASEPVYVPLASARALLARARTQATAPESTLSETALGDVLRPSIERGLSDPEFAH